MKQHRTVQELKSIVAKQEATIAQQQKGIDVLTATLKEQPSQIRKVTRLRRVEVSKPERPMVVNNQ